MGLNQFQNAAGGSKNLGNEKLIGDKQGQIVKVMILPDSFTPITKTNALLKATWTTLLQAAIGSRAYLTPLCDDTPDITPANVEFTPKTTGVPEKIKEFAPAFNLQFGKQNEAFYQNIVNFDGITAKVVLADANGNIYMFDNAGSLDGIKAKLEVSKRMLSDGTNYSNFMLKVTLLDANAWKLKKVVVQPQEQTTAWSFYDLDGVYDVAIKQIAASGTSITVQVYINSINPDDQQGQINGLVIADFTKNGGSAGSSSTPLGEGKYTIAGTFANDNVIDLVDTASTSIKAVIGIDCVEPLTISGIA